MAFLSAVLPAAYAPPLGSLLAGFGLLVVGLAALTVRRRRTRLQSAAATRRALLYALVYGLCFASFAGVIGRAMTGAERSPLLLALGDVIFVTLGLFVWVMVLAEGHSLGDYGLRRVPLGRLVLPGLMGLGAVILYGLGPYRALAAGGVAVTPDIVVFAVLLAAIGSALPDEILFRGYLMSTLDGRAAIWARVALPALAFTAARSLRLAPGMGVGSPDWLVGVFGVALPLGLLWGLMREMSGGALWPCLVSHFLVELGPALAGRPPEVT